jgi:hypothetical protein
MTLIPDFSLKQFREENPEAELDLRIIDEPGSLSQKLLITFNNKEKRHQLTQTHPKGVYFSSSFESVLVDQIKEILKT